MNNSIDVLVPPIPRLKKIDVLPKDILDVVSEICCCQTTPCVCPPCELYLVGSTIHDLIHGVVSPYKKDFDFFMITTSDRWLNNPSFSTLIANHHLHNHYIRDTKRLGGIAADLMIKSTTLSRAANDRDLSICSLFLRVNGSPDEIGIIYDPTDLGFDDLEQKQLRTVSDPVRCFAQDPICVLRTIKYLARGYAPTHSLSNALRQWNNPDCYDNDHFIRVLMGQLTSASSFEFIDQMKVYGLVRKMNWANAQDNESHDLIGKKLLSALHLRFYQRTISAYSYLVTPFNRPYLAGDAEDFVVMSTLSMILIQCNIDFHTLQQKQVIATKRRVNAERYNNDLLSNCRVTTEKLQQHITDVASIEVKITQITSQIKNIMGKISNKPNLLLQQIALHSEKQTELHESQETLNKLHADIDKEINETLDKNTQKQNANKIKFQESLQKEQEALLKSQNKNRKHQLSVDQQRKNHVEIIERTQQDKIQLELVHAEIQQLLEQQEVARIHDNNRHMDPYLAKIEDNLNCLTHDELKSLFSKTHILDFRGVVAYKLGLWSLHNRDYLNAFNYFSIVLNIYPDYKNTKDQIDVIKSHCSDICWTESNPKSWCEKALVARKGNKIDEALVCYTMAIQCDPNYINAYTGCINIFYQQNNWVSFIYDYKILSRLINQKIKTSSAETVVQLTDIKLSIDKKLQTAFTKHSLLMQQPEDSIDELTAWNYLLLTTLFANTQDMVLNRMQSYLHIMKRRPNNSIEYGILHFELARQYLMLNNILANATAAAHSYEVSRVLPCLDGVLTTLIPIENHLNATLSTAKEYFEKGMLYQQSYCYYSALNAFHKAIQQFPADRPPYWAYIRCCHAMSNNERINDEIIDGLINLYKQDKQLTEFQLFRPLTELHLYQTNYHDARITLNYLIQLDEVTAKDLFCPTLNVTLSFSLIDDIREKNKQKYLSLYSDTKYMEEPENCFNVNCELGKVALDEESMEAAVIYFEAAINLTPQPSFAYRYKQTFDSLCPMIDAEEQNYYQPK